MPIKWSAVGAAVGASVALLFLIYAGLRARGVVTEIPPAAVLIVCPPTLVLMATENGGWGTLVFAYCLLFFANAFLYALLFGGVGWLLNVLGREARSE